MSKHEDHAAWIGVSNKWLLERLVVTFCCRSTTRRAATCADSTIESLRKHSRRLNTCFTVFDGVKERQAVAAPCC